MNQLPTYADLTVAQRCEIIKPLWFDGVRASEIARYFIGATKNQIIGTVHRAKWPPRSLPQSMHKAKTDKLKQVRMRERMGELSQPDIEPVINLHPVAETHPDGMLMLDLVQLTEHTCKWPVGDPQLAGFGFCGLEPVDGRPYCKFHNRRSIGHDIKPVEFWKNPARAR